MPKFGKKSLEKLATCHPDIQKVLNETIKYFDFTVLEGRRTLETQKQYLKDGKTKTLNSKHIPDSNDPKQYARAVDIVPYPIDWEDRERITYLAGFIMGIAKQLNVKLRWGGDWDRDTELKDNNFDDLVHFELED